jgi:TonB family protein
MTSRLIHVTALLLLVIAEASVAIRNVGAQGTPQSPPQAAPVTYSPQEDSEFRQGTVSFQTPGVVAPTIVRRKEPNYPITSIRQKIKGDVTLEVVIGVEGNVEKARVKIPLHPSLDFEALKVIKEWQFQPARLNDAPVRVVVEVMMSFRMYGK